MDFQADAIDRVIKNAIQVVENSKYQMFEILETARDELLTLNQELQLVMKETVDTLQKVDQLELNYRRSRIRLTEVSRDFVRYKEDDIRQAYEKATQLQLDVMIYREKEM
ncbi:histidine kinase, partial [Paenibacillus sp. AR247]